MRPTHVGRSAMLNLFVDISSHGFGHLAQTAPLLNALTAQQPCRLTIRCAHPRVILSARIQAPFTHIQASSDFGFVMRNALTIDLDASALRYRDQHQQWPQRLAHDCALIQGLQPDLVLSNVSPLPLAAAAEVGIPSLAFCSLNWADLFTHYFGGNEWADHIEATLLGAYASARHFVCLTPGMAMPRLPNLRLGGIIAAHGLPDRATWAQRLTAPFDKRWLLIALGGIEHRLPVESWHIPADVHLLVPTTWGVRHPACSSYGADHFTDLLATTDVVLTKPGYGTFAECAVNGRPVLYLPRPDWPEQLALIDWLHEHGRALSTSETQLAGLGLGRLVDDLVARPAPPLPTPDGVNDLIALIQTVV